MNGNFKFFSAEYFGGGFKRQINARSADWNIYAFRFFKPRGNGSGQVADFHFQLFEGAFIGQSDKFKFFFNQTSDSQARDIPGFYDFSFRLIQKYNTLRKA